MYIYQRFKQIGSSIYDRYNKYIVFDKYKYLINIYS